MIIKMLRIKLKKINKEEKCFLQEDYVISLAYGISRRHFYCHPICLPYSICIISLNAVFHLTHCTDMHPKMHKFIYNLTFIIPGYIYMYNTTTCTWLLYPYQICIFFLIHLLLACIDLTLTLMARYYSIFNT